MKLPVFTAATVLSLFALASAPCVSAPLAAQSKATVAVIPYTNSAIGKANAELEPLTKGIADLMSVELSANTSIRLTERENLGQAIAEQNLSRDGRVDAATVVKLGKLLGVHHMVTGSFITDPKGTMKLTSRVFNAETGEIEFQTVDQDKTDNFMALVTKVAGKLNAGMKLPELAKQASAEREQAAKKMSFQAVMLYSRAIAAADAKKKGEAITLFRQTLKEFPDHEPSKKELAKLGETP